MAVGACVVDTHYIVARRLVSLLAAGLLLGRCHLLLELEHLVLLLLLLGVDRLLIVDAAGLLRLWGLELVLRVGLLLLHLHRRLFLLVLGVLRGLVVLGRLELVRLLDHAVLLGSLLLTSVLVATRAKLVAILRLLVLLVVGRLVEAGLLLLPAE